MTGQLVAWLNRLFTWLFALWGPRVTAVKLPPPGYQEEYEEEMRRRHEAELRIQRESELLSRWQAEEWERFRTGTTSSGSVDRLSDLTQLESPVQYVEGEFSKPSPPLVPASDNFRVVEIFYGTDRRAVQKGSHGDCSYLNIRSDDETVGLGKCAVSIPKCHKIGRLEHPRRGWFFREDPAKHVVLLRTIEFTEIKFLRALRAQVRQSGERDLFIFIHGFNVSFKDAARRTAQIASDLEFKGAPILYSWPSRNEVLAYPADEDVVNWTKPHFKSFLRNIVETSGARVIHLIAHSMGNRPLMRALHEIVLEQRGPAEIREVVLAAPDIEVGEFVQLVAAMRRAASRITLYASSNDKALAVSHRFHDTPRAGEAGENLIVVEGLDTIDASNVDTDFLGHAYPTGDRSIISDMSYLIRLGVPPQNRHGLHEKLHPKGVYWEVRA